MRQHHYVAMAASVAALMVATPSAFYLLKWLEQDSERIRPR